MDIATRFQPRVRAQSYLDRERGLLPDDSGGEAEARSRRKFQRTAPEDSTATFRKPALPASATRPLAERPGLAGRRRSMLRENRVPSGPRPLDFSPGKRIASESSQAPSTMGAANSRPFLPNSASEPFFSNTSDGKSNAESTFGFGSPSIITDNGSASAEPKSSFDFLPPVNFDDFQTTIKNYEPGDSPLLDEFASPEGVRALPRATAGNMARSNGFARGGAEVDTPTTVPQPSRTLSFRKRLSVAPRQPSLTTQTTSNMPPPSQPLSVRTRRQSTAPAAAAATIASSAAARPPRKSVGPGLITTMMNDGRRPSQTQTASIPVSASQPSLARTSSISKANRRITINPPASAEASLPRLSTINPRANKTKSMQPPPREPDPNTPIHLSANTGRPTSKRANTPNSSGNKRQSTANGRMSGLGARTISPTDTRRLKRMSMMHAPPMPNNVPRPNTPPTPQPDVPVQQDVPPSRFTQPSPSLIPRKSSITPSSARASPDASTRHLQSGGVSLSTSSSFQSLRGSNGSLASRMSINGSTSRLPTPKQRNVHSSTERYEELVPPVPAIPKAYESPKEQIDMPFFSNSLPKAQGKEIESSLIGNVEDGASMLPPLRASMEVDSPRKAAQHRRMQTVGSASAAPRQPQPNPAGRKNINLQPLRLPPLNLLPLSTPTTNRIASFPQPSKEVDQRDEISAVTPPPRRNAAKTPSTPMTASKATFFRRQDDAVPSNNLRSSSSHYALRGLTMNGSKYFDDSDSGVPIAQNNPRSAITPFSSGSLPKGSGEFARLRSRPSGEYDDYTLGGHQNVEVQPSKPQGPRPRTASKSMKGSDASSGNTDSSKEEPVEQKAQESIGGGLRRKLSMGWRRTSSKAASHSSPREEAPAQPPKHQSSEMPPPKLPASATWTGSIDNVTAPSVSNSARPSLENTIRKSVLTAQINEAEQNAKPARHTMLHSEQPVAAQRATSWSNFNPMNRAVHGKVSSTALKNQRAPPPAPGAKTDKDDLAADEEMKRLALKRKDVETAARETDELRRRATPKGKMSPERAMGDRHSSLNIFERGEIMDYSKDGVYFTGTRSAKKVIGELTSSADSKSGNFGYDDERGDYNIVVGDHLAYRYEVVDLLGKGSFGQVVRCVDHKDGGLCAVKIIRNKKRFHQQALVEVNILQKLKDWDPDEANATLTITSSFYFRSHLCITTPCLSINLYELIRAHNFSGFSLPLIRRFARQLLSCLVLLQNKRIIHCDLKPENILLCDARKADVRVIDFGSSCHEEEKVYTYIQSRFYRSPEVILGSTYGLPIDMWSLGCILAELFTGYPLFPGENEQEQLACIMEIFGPPERQLVERCTRKKLFFDSVGKPRVTVSSKGRRRRPSSKTLSQSLKCDDEAFLDFVSRCLRWDPDRRLGPADAINHPFITNQPLSRIPDEARARPRIRSSAAVPALPSPVKRVHTMPAATQHVAAMRTPAKDAAPTRPLPETPSTAIKNGNPVPAAGYSGSPVKPAANRRHSTVSANGPMAGSKRASNGAVLGAGLGVGRERVASARLGADLAQAAAAQSMGGGSTSAATAGKWK